MGDHQPEIPEDLIDLISSLILKSEINKADCPKFKFILTIINNDFAGQGLQFFSYANSGNEYDRVMLGSFAFKSFDFIKEFLSKNSSANFNHPKSKQIDDFYYGNRSEYLNEFDVKLRQICKKYNYSFVFLIYEKEDLFSAFKLTREIAAVLISSIGIIMEHVDSVINGRTLEDILEITDNDFFEDDDEELDDDFNIMDDSRDNSDDVDKDDDEFNNF